MPLAPGRFSMITCWPSRSLIFGAIRRDMMSVVFPGGNGMMMRTGFDGYDCGGGAAAHRMLHVREARRRLVVLVVASADRERDAIARGHNDGRRPDLDVELRHLARLERLLIIVGVIGPVRPRKVRIELAAR